LHPGDLLRAAGDFANPDTRQEAARSLARRVGATELYFFAPDPQLDVLLPPFGMPQTMHSAASWRRFVDTCRSNEAVCSEELADIDGTMHPARAVASENGCVAVLLGGPVEDAILYAFRPLQQLLGALFIAERRADAAEVNSRASAEAVTRSNEATRALHASRTLLQAALRDAESARAEARVRADQAEELAGEMQVQAVHLEEQAAALEVMNRELEVRTRQAEEAQQEALVANRAKSQFLATMSHELRTPINAIMGYTELLTMGVTGAVSQPQRDQLERIRASSRHLLTLINDVLDLAKIEAGHMDINQKLSPLRHPIEDAVGLLSLDAEQRQLTLVDECKTADITYWGDEDRVRQIITNLLSNAVKFTPPGGKITVRCDVTSAPDVLSAERALAFVEVEDTGIGMTTEDLSLVFRPFVQAEGGHSREHGGTGLGLTISRHLARLMGGELTATSEPGRGSCFTLWLPIEPVARGTPDEEIMADAHEVA